MAVLEDHSAHLECAIEQRLRATSDKMTRPGKMKFSSNSSGSGASVASPSCSTETPSSSIATSSISSSIISLGEPLHSDDSSRSSTCSITSLGESPHQSASSTASMGSISLAPVPTYPRALFLHNAFSNRSTGSSAQVVSARELSSGPEAPPLAAPMSKQRALGRQASRSRGPKKAASAGSESKDKAAQGELSPPEKATAPSLDAPVPPPPVRPAGAAKRGSASARVRPVKSKSAGPPRRKASIHKDESVDREGEGTAKSRLTSKAFQEGLEDSTKAPGNVDESKAAATTSAAKLCCDKCDGPHETSKCPHFKKARSKHKDAWSSYGRSKSAPPGGEDEKPIILANARVVRQPGDGSCLFHSLSYGMKDGSTGQQLRKDITSYIAKHPNLKISDTSIKEWVKYDAGGSLNYYVKKMKGDVGKWGGGIEMAAFTKMKNVNVHVYEKCKEGFKRISAFETPGAEKTVNVVYQGRMHYDALVCT